MEDNMEGITDEIFDNEIVEFVSGEAVPDGNYIIRDIGEGYTGYISCPPLMGRKRYYICSFEGKLEE